MAFATDGVYAPILSVALVSLAKTVPPGRRLAIHVLHDGLGEDDMRMLSDSVPKAIAELEFHDCSKVEEFLDVRRELSRHRTHIRCASYFRLLLPGLLSDVDRCLYLDCDLLFRSDISVLQEFDLSGCPVAAALDLGIGAYIDEHPDYADYAKRMELPDRHEYFNAGVLVMDLRRMREEDFYSQCRRYLLSSVDGFHDQDVLNLVARGRIARLDYQWNAQAERCVHPPEADNAAILHLTGRFKPWSSPAGEYLLEWWSCARESPYFAGLQRNAPWSKWVLASSWARGAYRCWLRVLALCSFGDRRRTYRRLYHGLGSLGRG